MYKQISKNPCNEKLKEKIVEIEKQLLDSHQKEKKNTEEKVIKACKKNRKYFFSYAKKYRKVKQNVGPIIDQKGDMKSNPKDMSEIILSHKIGKPIFYSKLLSVSIGLANKLLMRCLQ